MFDIVRNNKKVVQIFLALISLPFAFWGVDSYVRNASRTSAVATVGDVKVTVEQFQQELRERQDRFRNQLGPSFDPKMMDLPEVRAGVLNEIIDRRLLLLEAQKTHVVAGNEALVRAILAIPGFQENGKFSQERYESLLKMQGLSPQMFEAQLRQDITLQQLAGTVGRTGFATTAMVDRALVLEGERREVQEARLTPDLYLPQVKLEDGAARKYYEANGKQFEIPEQARAEFVVLSQDAIAAQTVPAEAEVKAWYEGHKDRYRTAEERRASHILVKAEGKEKDKARAKAEELLKEIQKNPAAFADLAKEKSDDPASGKNGGDLGFFGRGAMVQSFEDATFKLKEGEMTGLVESDFGFHIIKLTGIRPAKEKSFAEVRAEIESELKRAAAGRKFAETAEGFSNTVYEQSDSLKPVADKFKLAVQSSGWLNRTPNPANGPLGGEKILKALFSDDAVKSHRNTEAVEIAPNTLVAARIVEYKAASMQPFETVQAGIETQLKRQKAQELAAKDGQDRLAALKQGGDQKVTWAAAKMLTRADNKQLPDVALKAIFKTDASKLPAYAGVELPGGGYALYKLTKVDTDIKVDDGLRKSAAAQVEKAAAQQDVQAYLAALRARYKVEVHQAVLDAAARER